MPLTPLNFASGLATDENTASRVYRPCSPCYVDNTRDNDAQPLSNVVVADVTILAEERTAIFPPWTVPLVLFGLIVGLVVAPVLLNKRYMESGLGSSSNEKATSVPHLEQASAEATKEPPEG